MRGNDEREGRGGPLALAGGLMAGTLAGLVVLRSCAPERPPPELVRWAERASEPREPEGFGLRELRRLPGIGDRLAMAVLEARRAHEAAGTRLDWRDVRGIGPRTEARVHAWIRAHGGDPDRPLVESRALLGDTRGSCEHGSGSGGRSCVGGLAGVSAWRPSCSPPAGPATTGPIPSAERAQEGKPCGR